MQYRKATANSKGGDKNKLSNYPPISILPAFSKALEKVTPKRIDGFFSKHSRFNDSQFGSRKSRSKEPALLLQKENILNNTEAQNFTLSILVDFTKAFDRLNHEIPLGKLKIYGVRALFLELTFSVLPKHEQAYRFDR